MSPHEPIEMDSNIVRTDDVVFSNMDDEVVMMSVERGEYYGLNAAGSRIWELLSEPMSPIRICEVLTEEYDVTLEECRRDVLEILMQMGQKGLIRVL